jgi:hypothetical protein
MNWPPAIAAGLSGVVGALLVILLTPGLQHHFWRRQRRAELMLRTVEAVNTLTARFIQQWIAANGAKQEYRPTLEWYESFSATEGAVKCLFATDTYKMFKSLENRIEPDLGAIDSRYPNVNAFIEARDAALQALYSEVI